MPRPSKNIPLNRFTSSEIARGAGLSPRNVGLLISNGLTPPAAEGGGQVKTWDCEGLARTVLAGAMHKSGLDLLMSARLAKSFSEGFAASHGGLISRLSDYLTPPLNPTPTLYPWTSQAEAPDDFWLHRQLVTETSIYRRGQALKNDLILEIVDRRLVFLGGFEVEEASSPEYLLAGWERGKTAEITPFYLIDDAKEAWLEARRHAVGLLQINTSLAIRNGYDAIHETRADWRTEGA